MYKIITISREFGSAGRTIGKKLAEKLNYKFYDSELVNKVCEESGYHKDFVEKYGEDATSGSGVMFSFSRSGALSSNGQSLFDNLFIAQQKVILDLAKEGNMVIVGRCADYILKDFDNVLNVFIYADYEARKDRIIQEYGVKEDKAISKRIKEKDQKRKVYYKTYTGQEWGNPHNYDLSLNSSKLGIEKTVDLLYRIVRNEEQ